MRRVFTALVLIPIVLFVIYLGPPWLFAIVTSTFAILCFHEFSNIASGHNVRVPEWLGHVMGLVFLLIPWLDWRGAVIVVLVAFAWSLRVDRLVQAMPQAATLTFGILYVYGTWRCAFYLRDRSAHWLLFALALNWVGDTAAYYGGRTFGRHKLAPNVSPGKTVEGSIASIAGATIFGLILIGRVFPEVPMWEAAAISIVACIAGQVGDLVESAIKRGAGVKDSGTLVPGHGGWLDRLDSSLFSMPVVALYLSLRNPAA